MKRLAVAALATAGVAALGLGVRAGVASRPSATPTTRSVGATPMPTASAGPRVEQTVRFVPKPQDFTMKVRRTATRCGFSIRPPADLADQRIIRCKATYRTTASYHGKPLDPEARYVVFYQLVGGVLGSELQSFTVRNGQLPVIRERSALVHSGSALSAVANDAEWFPAP